MNSILFYWLDIKVEKIKLVGGEKKLKKNLQMTEYVDITQSDLVFI